MSSMAIHDGLDNVSKKRKKKYSSPFRIKVGYLVALRYRSRGNKASLILPDWDPSTTSELDAVEKDRLISFPEKVECANFSEIWTDPRRGRDEGLALIGSMIRCFFPKTILSEPYNAATRLLEGIIVNVVRDCEDQLNHKQLFSTKPSSFMVDLLVDNKDGKTLRVKLPFLKRVDNDCHTTGMILEELEQRRRQYEGRIKGGKHKAVVRIFLSNSSFSHSVRMEGNPLEVKWVIRKRVPTKIIRRESPVPLVKAYSSSTHGNDKDEVKKATVGKNYYTSSATDDTDHRRSEEFFQKVPISSPEVLFDSVEKKRPTKELDIVTSLNKNFSLPRYLGDGNDSNAQQEGNWRWEVGRYHNPCYSALGDRPMSKTLLEILCYNFVGEVVRISPMDPEQLEKPSPNSLAMVTIRLLILPEHTNSGRLSHHRPIDLFECSDLDEKQLLREVKQRNKSSIHRNNSSKKQRIFSDGNITNRNDRVSSCYLHVPIEELVIVERNICREYSDLEKRQGNIKGRKYMSVKYSYSFLNDTFTRCQKYMSENLDEENSGHLCRRCRRLSVTTKRLAGIPHSLCGFCFDFFKHKASLDEGHKKKTKKYDCDCSFCVDRKNSDLLDGLSDEVSESESKLGSTLRELKHYSTQSDSGFIATRLIIKGMNPIDFAISPSSLASFTNSASSKPVTKFRARAHKDAPKKDLKKYDRIRSNPNVSKNNKKISPGRKGEKRYFPKDQKSFSTQISSNEPFRYTSSRLLPYDVPNRKFDVLAVDLYQWKIFRSSHSLLPDKPRNLRHHKNFANGEFFEGDDSTKKRLQGRAARAKQRRLLRGVSALGVDFDTLAGRETNVRFDRSNIHGWGVFTDINIRQGEMIIEYRGELIGNAMAEKREKQYEAAKIGSDYMFRIDEYTVCDASKHGNVARFINASCMPNCYPKIIFLDGMKRVVVYAKRSIKAGEELCYDYKFDLEYDPAKRIPCICGAPECRGFLNWDQRYVNLPNNIATANSVEKNDFS